MPPRVARIVPEVSLDRAFDYLIPDEMDAAVALGAKVRVPFRSRELVGYVVDFPDIPFDGEIKPISEVLGPGTFLPPILIQLAQWISRYYCAPLTVSLMSVLPQAVRRADAAFKQRLWVEATVSALPDDIAVLLKKKCPGATQGLGFSSAKRTRLARRSQRGIRHLYLRMARPRRT